jgi:hypothetical protein
MISGSHSGDCEMFYFVGYNAVYSVETQDLRYLRHACLLAYSWTLKMDTKWSSETWIGFERTTPSYILEHRTFHFWRL